VDEQGNQEVFKIEGNSVSDFDQFRGNRIGADTDAIEFTELSGMGGEMQISVPVPKFADESNDLSLDMDEWRQTGAKLVFKLNDGTEITKTAEEIEYDLENSKLITSIHQEAGQYIISIKTQHTGMNKIDITGPELNILEQVLAQSIKLYPNPVRQGELLKLQLPEGINTLKLPYAVYNMAGQEIMFGSLDDKTAILAPSAQGTYILKFKIGQTVHSRKFIVK